MPSLDNASYGNVSYDGVLTESEPHIRFHAPWVFGGVRVEGIAADVDLGNVVPGESVTYRVVFLPGAESEDDEIANHVTRYKALREYRQNSQAVLTQRTPSGACYWREQHGGSSQLLRIQPLQAGAPGTTPDASEPPGRTSLWEGRWAVVDGVGADLTQPTSPDHQGSCVLELETTNIARTSEFSTERAIRAAREKSGL